MIMICLVFSLQSRDGSGAAQFKALIKFCSLFLFFILSFLALSFARFSFVFLNQLQNENIKKKRGPNERGTNKNKNANILSKHTFIFLKRLKRRTERKVQKAYC